MKKADNFDSKKWLVENKITFQSRLNEDKKISIEDHKDEALEIVDEFIDEYKSEFEFIPNTNDYTVDKENNGLNIEELGSIYLIPNNSPIPSYVQKLIDERKDTEGIWKKYQKDGYYYIVIL